MALFFLPSSDVFFSFFFSACFGNFDPLCCTKSLFSTKCPLAAFVFIVMTRNPTNFSFLIFQSQGAKMIPVKATGQFVLREIRAERAAYN